MIRYINLMIMYIMTIMVKKMAQYTNEHTFAIVLFFPKVLKRSN